MNWRLLHSLDLDRVIHEGDVDTVQGYMDNIMFARFNAEDLQSTTDESIVKVVQLSQLCMEFLYSMCTASQQLLQSLIEKVKTQSAQLKAAESRSRQRQAADKRTRRRSLSRDQDLSKRAGVVPRKCVYCGKRFQTEQYLHDHIMRRHPAEFGQSLAQPMMRPVTPERPVGVHQPEPSPVSTTDLKQPQPTDPSGVEKMEKALGSVAAGLQEQLRVVHQDFSQALRAMREDVNHVADDVVKLKDTPAPTPAPTPMASLAAGADVKELEKRQLEHEKHVAALFAENQRLMVERLQAVTQAAPAAGATAVPNISIEAQLEELRRVKDDFSRQLQQRDQADADARAAAAKDLEKVAAKAAAEAAEAVRKAAPPPAAAPPAREPAPGAWGAPEKPAAPLQPAVVIQEDPQPSRPSIRAEANAPQPTPVTPVDFADTGDSSKETARISAPGSEAPAPPPAQTQVQPGAGVGDLGAAEVHEDLMGPYSQPPEGPASFVKTYEDMQNKLQTEEEQLLLTIAMTQERTRPRGQKRQGIRLLSPEQAKEAVRQEVPVPDPVKDDEDSSGKAKTPEPAKPTEKEVKEQKEQKDMVTTEKAFQSSLKGFLLRCRRGSAGSSQLSLPGPGRQSPLASTSIAASASTSTLPPGGFGGPPPAATSAASVETPDFGGAPAAASGQQQGAMQQPAGVGLTLPPVQSQQQQPPPPPPQQPPTQTLQPPPGPPVETRQESAPQLQRQGTQFFPETSMGSAAMPSAAGPAAGAGQPAAAPAADSRPDGDEKFYGDLLNDEVSDISERGDASMSHNRSSARASAVEESGGQSRSDMNVVTGFDALREQSFASSAPSAPDVVQDMVRPADKSFSSMSQSEATVGIGGWGAPERSTRPSAADINNVPRADQKPPVGIGGWGGAPASMHRSSDSGGGARAEEPMAVEEADDVMGFSVGESSGSDERRQEDVRPRGMQGPMGMQGPPLGMQGPPLGGRTPGGRTPGGPENDMSMESIE